MNTQDLEFERLFRQEFKEHTNKLIWQTDDGMVVLASESGVLDIDPSKIVATLTAAIQELKAELDQLKSQIGK